MRDGWQAVKIGEILEPVRDLVTVKDDDSYRQVTVSLQGRGLCLRGVQTGADIKTKRQFRVREGVISLCLESTLETAHLDSSLKSLTGRL